VARSGHALFSLAHCPKDPLRLLHQSESGRVPALVALKHQRMAVSPFGFFRGAVPVMAADLSVHPNTGLLTQLCGDAHVENLGAYASPLDGRLLFNINDFDETIRGPFEWDLKRLATSLILAGREAGIKKSDRMESVLHLIARYRGSMQTFAAMPVLEMVRHQIHRLARVDPMPAILAQARRSTPQKTLKSLTQPASRKKAVILSGARSAKSKHPDAADLASPGRRFRTDPPVLRRATATEAAAVLASLPAYLRTLEPERRHFLAQYRAMDVGFKVVGTGSVGLRDYCIYLEGTHTGNSDPLFLQIKEETHSAYASYLPASEVPDAHQGQRVADGQRAMQLSSDPFLGYTSIPDAQRKPRHYLVRQLNDHKASLDLTALDAPSLLGYADLCGEIFAQGHARAGDPVALSAYLGNGDRFDQALLRFASAYADKTERDWALLKKSMKT
jgi:uncharacterized protein (DUF2252 family)